MYFNSHSSDDNKLGEHEDLSSFAIQSRMNLIFSLLFFFPFSTKIAYCLCFSAGSRVNIFVAVRWTLKVNFPKKFVFL